MSFIHQTLNQLNMQTRIVLQINVNYQQIVQWIKKNDLGKVMSWNFNTYHIDEQQMYRLARASGLSQMVLVVNSVT